MGEPCREARAAQGGAACTEEQPYRLPKSKSKCKPCSMKHRYMGSHVVRGKSRPGGCSVRTEDQDVNARVPYLRGGTKNFSPP